jgi:hypothetical protein
MFNSRVLVQCFILCYTGGRFQTYWHLCEWVNDATLHVSPANTMSIHIVNSLAFPLRVNLYMSHLVKPTQGTFSFMQQYICKRPLIKYFIVYRHMKRTISQLHWVLLCFYHVTNMYVSLWSTRALQDIAVIFISAQKFSLLKILK